jgi:hypothetical protein
MIAVRIDYDRGMGRLKQTEPPPSGANLSTTIEWYAAKDPLGHRVHLLLAMLAMATMLLSSSLATITSSILIGYTILRASDIWRIWRTLPTTPVIAVGVALYLWLALSLLWSTDPGEAGRLLRGVRYLLLVPALLPVMNQARLLLMALVIGVIIQFCAQLTGVIAGWEEPGGGLSKHPGHSGLWFSLALGFLVLAQPLKIPMLAPRAGLSALVLVGLVMTAARSAIACTLLGLVAGAGLLLLRLDSRGARLAFAGATIAVLLGGAVIGSQMHVGTRVSQAYTSLTTPYETGEFPMDRTRPLWWRIGLGEWSERPITGAGLGSAASAIPKDPEVIRILEGDPKNSKVLRDDYHSLYVTTLADSGLVGLGLLIAWLALVTLRVIRSGPMAPVLLVGLIAYLGYGFFNTTLFSGRLVAFIATLIAFSLASVTDVNNSEEASA